MSNLSVSAAKTAESEASAVSEFGYELLRDILLPELLGKDAPEILYWAGKRIARQFPLESLDEICMFFRKADWGTLTITKQSKNELEAELQGRLIAKRLKTRKDPTFQLEAGFIAQQIELQKAVIAEAFEHPSRKGSSVKFTIKWDNKDSVNF